MASIAAFSIRMSRGPMDLNFIKPRIEAALSDKERGYTVEIGNLNLSWPSLTAPLLLDLKSVKINQPETSGATVEKIKIALSARHMLVGQILPSVLIIEDPTFQLVQKDGEIKFFWQQKDKPDIQVEKEQKPKSQPIEGEEKFSTRKNIRETRKSAQDFMQQIFSSDIENLSVLSALKRVELRRAVIISSEAETGKGSYLALIDLNLHKNSYGIEGHLAVTLPGSEGEEGSLQSSIVYRRDKKDVTFAAKVKNINPAYFAALFPQTSIFKDQSILLDGTVQAAFDKNFRLQNAALDLNIPQGRVIVPDVYDEGIDLKNIILKAAFNRGKRELNISDFQASIDNVTITGAAQAQFEKGHITAPITLKIADVQTDDLGAIFPKSRIETPLGKWLTHKLSKGRLYDALLNTTLQISVDPQTRAYNIEETDTKASFKGEGVTVRYSDTLKPVTDAIAEGVYEDDTLTIIGSQGKVGAITGKNINLKLTNLSETGGGMAYLTLQASGPFKTALDFISDKPISMGNNLGFDVKAVQGNVDAKIDLEFPTKHDLSKDEVIVKIDGTLSNILIPNIVKGMPLSGGPFKLGFGGSKISLSGKGQVGSSDADITYEEFLSDGHEYQSKITAKVIADAGLRHAFNIGLEEYISGNVPIEVTYLDKGAQTAIDVKADLTPAKLTIEPFHYKKAEGEEGTLSLKAFMKGETLEEVDNLQLEAKNLKLSKGRLLFRTLSDGTQDVSRGSLEQVLIGKSNLKVDFEITPENVLKVIAAGSVFDLSPFIGAKEKQTPTKAVQKQSAGTAEGQWQEPIVEKARQPMQISLQAQKIIGEKNQVINNSKVYLETDAQGDITRIEMDAAVGQGNMYLRFKPDEKNGKRIFRLESDDAGATLNTFGLYENIIGGNLIIYGEPRKGDNQGDLFGKAEIDGFNVKKAPTLAKLLGSMSQSGAQELLQKNQLTFAKLESDFEWQFREGGNLLVMKNGRTSGSALGLTFEGVYNQKTENVDISGTVIPLSGVNKVIGEIPLIGKILTGGGAFLAASYTISGSSEDTKVSINPLSVLAPGIIRNILFEENIETKVEKAQ